MTPREIFEANAKRWKCIILESTPTKLAWRKGNFRTIKTFDADGNLIHSHTEDLTGKWIGCNF